MCGMLLGLLCSMPFKLGNSSSFDEKLQPGKDTLDKITRRWTQNMQILATDMRQHKKTMSQYEEQMHQLQNKHSNQVRLLNLASRYKLMEFFTKLDTATYLY